MALGFLTPDARLRVFSDVGVVLSGAKLNTYVAGTPSTPLATYSDSALTTPNTNPVVASAGGLFGPIYLTPGVAYKLVLTDSASVVVWTQDNVMVPGGTATVPSGGTGATTFTAHGVLLGQGAAAIVATGAGTLGQVLTSNGAALDPTFQTSAADNGLDDFRLTLESGVPVSKTDQLAKATLFCTPSGRGNLLALYDGAGLATVLASAQFSIALPASTNTNYDVFAYNNAGVATLELLAWRNSGQAITGATTATPIVITAVAHGLANGDEVYVNGVLGNTGADGTWTVAAVAANTFELTGSIGAGAYTAATGWLNARTAAGKLVLTTTGTYTKTADLTRRYKGLVRTGTVAGQSEDSLTKRYCWNATNRVRRPLQRYETVASWTYTTATTRQARADATNQVELVVGLSEATLDLALTTGVQGSTTVSAGIGEDTTTQFTVGQSTFPNSSGSGLTARLVKGPAPGRHLYAWNEWSTAVATTTWNGAVAAVGGAITSGLIGWIEG